MGIVQHQTSWPLWHPSEEVLEEYVLHRLPETRSAHIEEHLLICRECQDTVASIDQFVTALKRAVRTSPAVSPVLMRYRSMAPIAALAMALMVIWNNQEQVSVSPVDVSLSSWRAGSPLAPAPAGKRLTFKIEVPDLELHKSYRIEVVDAAGSIEWKAPLMESDGKLIASISRPLVDGVYWVRLYDANSELLREFGLSAK
jgi:hypothetical protein